MTEDFESLYESHLKAQHGVIWKGSVAWFSLHAPEQILQLSNELREGSYAPKPPITFTITHPKKRDILAVAYRDRVYQRSINDRILYPVMTRSFVKENGACQIGKGTSYCIDLFRKQLRRFYINHGLDGYILQIDIRKYYPSMRHDVVKEMFRKKLDPETYETVAWILDNQYEGDIGYNPGSQMVQIAGISLLNGIDHFIKQKLHIKDYIRVMDDMVLIHESREYLEICLEAIREELSLLHLEVHDEKTQIVPMKDGITFLGFEWKLTETGKVLQFPKSQNVKNYRRSMEKLMKLYAKGERTRRCIEESQRSRMDFMANGTSYLLIQRLTRWYNRRMQFYEHQKQQFLQAQKSLPERTGGTGQPPRRKR